jgi:hypothetical protein
LVDAKLISQIGSGIPPYDHEGPPPCEIFSSSFDFIALQKRAILQDYRTEELHAAALPVSIVDFLFVLLKRQWHQGHHYPYI